MSETTQESTAGGCVVLPPSCTLKEATTVKAMLVDALDAGGDAQIDARTVERLDTSALQLLAAFVRDMHEAGRAVAWLGAPAELHRAARQLGLTGLLGLPATT